MAHGRREHPKDDRYNGETNPRSENASEYHPSENEHVEVPPQSMMPMPPSHHFGYAPWNALPPHHGGQEPWYAVPGANDSAPDHGAWQETRQLSFRSRNERCAPIHRSRYGNARGVVPYHWDNGNPAGATWVHAPSLVLMPNGTARQALPRRLTFTS
ncbi:hypothetical protein EDB84DRAFT_220824 [Lactarius hengduanensis]|nr:hypothetical protein EDB84DRAFT_220824 [Lactarius hengduanensis]